MFSDLIEPVAAPPADAVQRFLRLLQTSGRDGSFLKLLLSGATPAAEGVLRLQARPLALRGEPHWQLVAQHATRDLTRNLPTAQALDWVAGQLGIGFRNAHLHTRTQEVQLAFSRKGRPSLRVSGRRGDLAPADPPGHDRPKVRALDLQQPVWQDLGLTHRPNAQAELVPAMARKWKQMNKFIEVLQAALARSPLAGRDTLRVADFGAGKGYLTFAVHAWLQAQGVRAQVTGVDLRGELVALGNAVARAHGCDGLTFEQGDVRERSEAALDVMIALHACDIATDHALHLGCRAGAAVLLCAPCCHQEVRPQMHSPAPLRPLLRHGVHLGQEAEMVTDALRALLLEAEGYDTQVFEFIALEHTQKNKMILAVRRADAAGPQARRQRADRLAEVDEIKRFYGLRTQCLEALLRGPSAGG